MKPGFIGLGIMGAPMAGHLLAAGHALLVHTRRAVPPALLDAGALACANAADVARQADTAFLMLPDTPDVAAVLFGDNGVVSGRVPGKTLVNMRSLSRSIDDVYNAKRMHSAIGYPSPNAYAAQRALQAD